MNINLSKILNVAFIGVPVITLSLLFLFVVSEITYYNSLNLLSRQGQNKLELYVTYLEGLLEKYESLPELFASDEKLVNNLQNFNHTENIESLNRYLEKINTISNISDTYLMNKDGLTIAASNWNAERPFVGRNFSYRPYFKEAMTGKLGRYFALGTTSSRRGYYFAYPVRKDNQILGAVVVKVNIDSAEQKWRYLEQELLVTDPDGVVFITTNPGWRFKIFGKLDDETLSRIAINRRYPVETLESVDYRSVKKQAQGEIVELFEDNRRNPSKYLVQVKRMEHAGWDVKIFSDMKEIKGKTTKAFFATLFVEIVIVIFILSLLQRQMRLSQLKKHEHETRIMLQEANEKLESRVLARTAELTDTNVRLTQEIVDRKNTEEALKQTREELIHAAKLAALGQMSAGINHEMNQPLAAIRSYAENANLFLEKGRINDTKWNLDQIAELTERMGQVVAQLKLFSRKSSGQITVVPLHGVIDGALEILKPSIRRSNVEIVVNLEPKNVEVLGNNVLLQQVFVNLINNGIQAVEEIDGSRIEVRCTEKNNLVHILVEDNGEGIENDKLPHIFEPFFTTKISGQGLGLGLTITDRILEEVEGKIFVTSSKLGTLFEIILKKA